MDYEKIYAVILFLTSIWVIIHQIKDYRNGFVQPIRMTRMSVKEHPIASRIVFVFYLLFFSGLVIVSIVALLI